MHSQTLRHHSNVHVEVRAPGEIDAERMRSAVYKAMGAHPMTRARQLAHKASDRNLQWQITSEPSFDPLLVVEGGDDESVDRLRQQLLNMLPPLHDSPPFYVWLVRRPGGDSLIFNFNHCAGDGIGCLHFLRSVIDNYAGKKEEGETVDPIEIRKAPGISNKDQKERKQQQDTLKEVLRRNMKKAARLAPEGGTDRSAYDGLHLIIDKKEFAQLNAKRHVKATINDLLIAAMHKSVELWNKDHAVEANLVIIQTPVNLRPAHWQNQVLGNYIGSFPTITVPEQRGTASDLMNAVAEQTRSAKEMKIGALMYDVLQFQNKVPIFARELLMPALIGAANSVSSFVSNLGAFPANLSFGDGQDATEVWFSPPALMSAGIGLGVLGYKDSLFLGFRYANDHFDSAAAQRFGELYRETLHWLS